MEPLAHAFSYLLEWWNALPPHALYTSGTMLASIPVVVALVEVIKRHHLSKQASELASHLVILNVAFWGFLVTATDFILTNGQTAAQFWPFLSLHWAQVSGGAIATHTLSTALLDWWKARQAGKPLFAASLPELAQASSPAMPATPAASLPLASASEPLAAPAAELWQ